MTRTAFVVMRIGQDETSDRRRANEVLEYIIEPALRQFGMSAYRADRDPSPGAITPRIISKLISADLVVADLTGRNPNVCYELGVAHSFGLPLVALSESAGELPFDIKDENVIQIGPMGNDGGLGIVQAGKAKDALVKSLAIVTADGYVAPSPIRAVAATKSLNDLAPDNPVVAELAEVRMSLDGLAEQVAQQSHVVADPDLNFLEALKKIVWRRSRQLGQIDLFHLRRFAAGKSLLWLDDLETHIDMQVSAERSRQAQQKGTPDPWSGPADDEPPF